MAASSRHTLYARPTLPSLHTLGLPNPIKDMVPIQLDSNGAKYTTKIDERVRTRRARQLSISSTASSSSYTTNSSGRSTSPCEFDASRLGRVSASSPPVHSRSNSLSLVRSTMEEANAFVLVPPQHGAYVENISSYSRSQASSSKARRNQALLLVGPAVEYLRHPKVRIAKGARLHPYRVVTRTTSRHQPRSPPKLPNPDDGSK